MTFGEFNGCYIACRGLEIGVSVLFRLLVLR